MTSFAKIDTVVVSSDIIGSSTSVIYSAVQSAIDKAYDRGCGVVQLPSGDLRVNDTLDLPSGVELRGVGHSRFVPHLGTRLVRSTDVPLLRSIGTSVTVASNSQIYRNRVTDLTLHGGGPTFFEDVVQIKAASGLIWKNVNTLQCGGRLLFAHELFDSWFYSCRWEDGATADGSLPSVELVGGGSYEYTNQLHFVDNIWESSRGRSIDITGELVNELFFHGCKIEALNSDLEAFRAVNASVLHLNGMQFSTRGTSGATIDAVISLDGCAVVNGSIYFEHVGATPAHITQLIHMVDTSNVNLEVFTYGGEEWVTADQFVTSTGSQPDVNVVVHPRNNPNKKLGLGGQSGSQWAKSFETLDLSRHGEPFIRFINKNISPTKYWQVGRLDDIGGGNPRFRIIYNDNDIELAAVEINNVREFVPLYGVREPTNRVTLTGTGQANAAQIAVGFTLLHSVAAGSTDSALAPTGSNGRKCVVRNGSATDAALLYPKSGIKMNGVVDAAQTIPAGKAATIVYEANSASWWGWVSA